MTQVVQAKCPHCQNVLRIPAEWLARPMRCKFCKQVIQAKGAATTATAVASAPPPAQALAISPAGEAQAAFAAPAVASAPRRSSDPFSFDDAVAPTPIPTRSRKKGKGWVAAALLVVFLSTMGVLLVVFNGPQLREFLQGKSNGPIVENDGKSNQDGDKGPDGENSTPATDGGAPKRKKSPNGGGASGKELFPRRALLININNYWVLNPVHYGTSQASGYPGSSTQVLRDRFANAPMYFPATQVVELSDSAAEPIIPQKSVIEDAIATFCNTSRDQDRIVILFAGHAVEIEKEAYLIPYEGNKDDAKTLIPLSWVYDKLAKCKARQKILILDAFRFPPARGYELPGTGAMTEDFDAKLQNPPPGVQVWSACVKDQQSLEFEGGSLFLQCVCHALQDRLGGFANPDEAIPVETLAVKVNQRMKDLLAKTKLEQVARLSGKESEGGANYDPKAPLPPQIALKPAAAANENDKAGAAQINNILAEMKQIPPMKASLKAYISTLKADAMPPFPKKVLDFYKTEYKSWADLETKLKDKKYAEQHPLRAAVLESKKALDKAEQLILEDSLSGPSPVNDKTKTSFLNKQKPIGMAIFELEEAWGTMKEAAEMRDKEENKRWQANFDYALARLQSRLVYLHEYDYILGDIRADRLPALEGDASGWRLGFKQKVSTNESKVKNMVKDIGKLWKKIGEEHPNTPWALLAQRESLYALGLEWRASRD